MARIIFLSIMLGYCLIIWPADASAQQILVVRNQRFRPYSEALSGFRHVLDERFKGVDYIISEGKDAASTIRRKKPDLVLAIGIEALYAVKNAEIAVVYLMVILPSADSLEEKNITGVSMTISPERQLSSLRRIIPGARRVGLLYDPKKSGAFVRKAQRVARGLRMDLLAKEVSHAKDVSRALGSLKGSIDAIWMIPDTTVVTPETAELIMLFSLENRLPVCAFSAKYLELGAFMSLDVSAFDMGKQAGDLAARILSGANARDIPPVEADNPSLIINESVARKLRIPLGDDLRSKVRIFK
jgi:putative ABC transport system substrate-binding protein